MCILHGCKSQATILMLLRAIKFNAYSPSMDPLIGFTESSNPKFLVCPQEGWGDTYVALVDFFISLFKASCILLRFRSLNFDLD